MTNGNEGQEEFFGQADASPSYYPHLIQQLSERRGEYGNRFAELGTGKNRCIVFEPGISIETTWDGSVTDRAVNFMVLGADGPYQITFSLPSSVGDTSDAIKEVVSRVHGDTDSALGQAAALLNFVSNDDVPTTTDEHGLVQIGGELGLKLPGGVDIVHGNHVRIDQTDERQIIALLKRNSARDSDSGVMSLTDLALSNRMTIGEDGELTPRAAQLLELEGAGQLLIDRAHQLVKADSNITATIIGEPVEGDKQKKEKKRWRIGWGGRVDSGEQIPEDHRAIILKSPLVQEKGSGQLKHQRSNFVMITGDDLYVINYPGGYNNPEHEEHRDFAVALLLSPRDPIASHTPGKRGKVKQHSGVFGETLYMPLEKGVQEFTLQTQETTDHSLEINGDTLNIMIEPDPVLVALILQKNGIDDATAQALLHGTDYEDLYADIRDDVTGTFADIETVAEEINVPQSNEGVSVEAWINLLGESKNGSLELAMHKVMDRLRKARADIVNRGFDYYEVRDFMSDFIKRDNHALVISTPRILQEESSDSPSFSTTSLKTLIAFPVLTEHGMFELVFEGDCGTATDDEIHAYLEGRYLGDNESLRKLTNTEGANGTVLAKAKLYYDVMHNKGYDVNTSINRPFYMMHGPSFTVSYSKKGVGTHLDHWEIDTTKKLIPGENFKYKGYYYIRPASTETLDFVKGQAENVLRTESEVRMRHPDGL